MNNKLATCLLLLFTAPIIVSLDIRADASGRNTERLVLDETRTDDLGWTDAHHVAYRTPSLVRDGREYAVPTGDDAVRFLEAASEDHLCVRNDFGQTALHLAVRESNVDIVDLYVERRISCINVGNKDGDTPLHYAAYWGRFECARLLVEGGASVRAKNDKGHTPLDDAREVGHQVIVDLLSSGVLQEEDSKIEL